MSLCGNSVVGPGEEYYCGDTQETSNDPCCYPAYISLNERASNKCVTPPELFNGIYMLLAFILTVVILVTVFLHHDWTRDKSLFKHVTEGNIKIVTKRSRAASSQVLENGTAGDQARLPNSGY